MTFAPFANGYRIPPQSVLGNATTATAPMEALSSSDARSLIGAVATDDPRLSDARSPLPHKAAHATGGSDALTPADIGAATDAQLAAHAAATSGPHGIGSFAATLLDDTDAATARRTLQIIPPRSLLLRAPWLGEPYYAQSLTTFAVTANVLYLIPWPVWESMVVDALICEVTTGVAGIGRMGIYRADASNPLLATRVAECSSTFDAGTAAVHTLAISPGTLEPDWYYLAIVSTGAATFRAWSNVAAGAAVKTILESLSTNTAPYWARFVSGLPTGSLPASVTATGALAISLISGNAPRLLYRRTA